MTVENNERFNVNEYQPDESVSQFSRLIWTPITKTPTKQKNQVKLNQVEMDDSILGPMKTE